MSKEFMDQIFKWSEGKVSTETAELMVKDEGQESKMSLAERSVVTKHLEFKAFASTAWTVWSR
jgi:hypothetical protein